MFAWPTKTGYESMEMVVILFFLEMMENPQYLVVE